MVDLTESLLKAISIIADKSAEEVFSDKTIKAIVKKVVNTSEGKYLVTYNSGDFYAYIQSGSTDVYEIGEQIYILVPEGDMSQKKFIIGRVKDDEEDSLSSKVLKSSLLNDYVTIGDNIVIEKEYGKLAVKKMQPLKLNSYSISDFYYCYLRDPSIVSDLPKNHYDNISYPCVNIDEETFANSAKQAEALLIRAKFKASIDTDIIGNYGIIVNIAFADETNPQTDENGKVTYPPKLIAYVLDTSKMTGNPMKFYDYTSQYAITGFDGENYLYIDSIVAFSEGFVNQTTPVSNENNDPYIYIDNLEIVALDENSAVNGDYKLKLTTPQGNTIKVGKRDELKIAAAMTYLNQDITENTVFYWGVKDPSITSISDEYHAKLGSGYKYLDIKNTNELRLVPGDLTAAENIYICVGVYASNIILKSTVSLYNNNNKLDITIDSDQGTIFQFNEGNPTLTCLINGKSSNYQKNYSDEAFSFIWTKEDPEFGSILLNTTEAQLEKDKQKEINECRTSTVNSAGRTITQVLSYYSTRIAQVKNISFPNGTRGPKINCKLKNTNSYVTYSCSVYRGNAYIGYGSITLQNSKSVVNNNYYVTITNGTQVFQYDEAGIAPNSQRKQEPIEVLDLVAVFHSPQGAEVTPKKVRWIMPEGKTLINIPSIGLETDGETGRKYFVGNIFPLTIKDTYDNTCNDNQVTVIVTHNDGTEYRQTSNLLFTKIGEIGTNGTNTVVKINEPMNVPKDECLTIIKSKSKISYNNGDSTDDPILEASLYTNNTQTLGYTTNWSIAGSSKSQSRNYEVKSYNNNNNFCTISYNGNVDEVDTRIIKAEINLEGKYFYSFYGIPAIEYNGNYNYKNYPIKIMRDGTLRTVLYDSNGTNPTYNKTQGAHIELPGWSETGYINWSVESGVKRNNGEYQNPNFLLAISPKSETGSEKLIKSENELGNIKTSILAAYDTGNICKNNASSIIKDYITDFLEDVEKICVDTLLSTSNKLSELWNRLAAFNDENNVPDNQNIYIKTVYQEYYNLFEMMQTEYDACKDINTESTKLYDKIQAIWRGMWPSVITEERLNIVSGLGSLSGINTIEKLIDKYQQLYNNRSNDSIDDFDESDIFDKKKDDDSDDTFFLTLLNRNKEYYNEHVTSLGQNVVELSPILIRYAQVLMTYLNLLVEETQSCFEDNNLHNIMKEKYSFIYSDWGSLSNSGNNHVIGQTIYDIVLDANGEFASVSESICGLYKFYRELYLGINKYQIAEESETLNTWSSILKGENPNLLNQIYVIPNKEFNGLYMNNNVVGTAYIKSGNNNNIEIAKIYIPIIMTLNTYELASLNGWDGTSVEIGDNHILTPQIGAGIKDDVTNTFTGMVMGVIGNSSVSNNSNNNNNNNNNFKLKKANKIGLIGYSNGKQSLFIDSETGEASFGLPEEDNDTENGTNEGRIELVPGGISKIGNWKIGNRFLYNIVDGTYEIRNDEGTRPGFNKSKIMIPHNKYGIILSSDQPYIHVKGEIYGKNNDLTDIDYNDEYNNINPGDSLELKMDPNNKSLFSIVQHTTGFGDEDIGDLLFGYKSSDSETDKVIVVKSYIMNKEILEEQNFANMEYYVYRLVKNNNGKYVPYYEEKNIQNLQDFYKINSNSWLKESSYIFNETRNLNTVLEENNFKQAFTIDENTGIITYDPNKLKWNTSSNFYHVGNSYEEKNWWCTTEDLSSLEDFSVTFRYNEDIETSNIENLIIGNIQNNTNYKIYKMKINSRLNQETNEITFNGLNNYIQFYVVPASISDSNNIDQDALLVSDMINFKDNWNNIDIELSSFKNRGLSKATYCIKMKLYICSYTIDTNCTYMVRKSSEILYKEPPQPPYGTARIFINNTGSHYFYTKDSFDYNLYGSFRLNYQNNIWTLSNFYVYYQVTDSKSAVPGTEDLEYDFIIWKQNKNNTSAFFGGRISSNNSSGYKARFFTSTETKWDDLNTTIELNSEDSWYVSFYPKEYCTIENIQYDTQTAVEQSEDSPEIIPNTTTWNIKEGFSVYKLIDNFNTLMTDKIFYSINWNNNYEESMKVNWKFKLTGLTFNEISIFTPKDVSKLCVKENLDKDILGLQGILLAKTFQENNKQKVTFLKDYYNWVNDLNHPKDQYSYIDISNNNNKYYKYIKTLDSASVNSWFNEAPLISANDFSHGNKNGDKVYPWITISTSSPIVTNSLNWKDFLRVGIDENGRFFSAGRQDKTTYNRTGKIYSFGKVPNLYGQEIRVQLASNTYIPIIKMFSQTSDTNITYITQGQNDNGNISIRTAGSDRYIELAASQFSNNENNSIPENDHFVKVGYNKGVEIQTNKGANKIILTNNDQLNIETKIISIISKDNNNVTKVSCNFTNDGYVWIKSPSYVVSSAPASNGRNASSISLNGLNNSNEEYYRINAFNDNTNKPTIKLQTGRSVELNINSVKAILKANSDHFIEINNSKNYLKAGGNISIELNSNTANIILNNHGASIKISPINDDITARNYIIKLNSNLGSKFEIGDGIKVISNKGMFINTSLYANGGAFIKKDIHIGQTENGVTKQGMIYLYNNNDGYIRLSAETLKQLLDWYRTCRWAIGIRGNTLMMRSLDKWGNPEGSYNKETDKYEWNINNISDYSYTSIYGWD